MIQNYCLSAVVAQSFIQSGCKKSPQMETTQSLWPKSAQLA